MPAPTCSDASREWIGIEIGAIEATVKPPFPSKPGYLLGLAPNVKIL
jgi:hypothetical protein